MKIQDEYLSMPSKALIAEYWFEKVKIWWKDKKYDEMPKWMKTPSWDMGEPFCFACGYDNPYFRQADWDFWSWHDYEEKEKYSWQDILNHWNAVPLERCHVVPKSLGGTYHPSNVVLLCKKCHKEAPDTGNAKYFWVWMDNRWGIILERTRKKAEAYVEAIDSLGIDRDWFLGVLKVCQLDVDYNKYQTEKGTLHFSSNGPMWKDTTDIACRVAFFREKYKDVSPEDVFEQLCEQYKI